MYLKQIVLKQFRNYKKQEFSFPKKVTVITGANGQGKTNLLEAIYFLSTCRSFRTRSFLPLIQWHEPFFNIQGLIDSYGVQSTLHIAFSKEKKSIILNDQRVQKFSDAWGTLKTVVLTMDDSSLIKGRPADRRRYLDLAISRMDNTYLLLLQEYAALLKRRNSALKNQSLGLRGYKDILTDRFIETGAVITEKRKKICHAFQQEVVQQAGSFIRDSTLFEIRYATGQEGETAGEIQKSFSKNIEKSREQESVRRQTLFGPHLDDFILLLNGKPLQIFGSGGQQRAAVIALKMAEIQVCKNAIGAWPLILIDDIFGELDAQRRQALLPLFQSDAQILMTCVDLHGFCIQQADCQELVIEQGQIKAF